MTLFVLNVGNNIDHGAIPVITPILKTELDMNPQQLGFLGSLVFMGITLGSIVATFILTKYSYKSIIGIAMCLNGIGLLVFACTTYYPL